MVLEVVFIAHKPYPSFGGQESFLILQESQTPLFQQGRIPSSLLDTPRPVPLYYISYLLGSVCGVDFLLGYLFFPSTLDQMCRPQKHSGGTTHNARWGNQSWDAEHRCSCLCAITFSSQTCIYISDQYWEFPPVWKSTKTSHTLVLSHTHSELFMLLDATSPT